LVSLEHTGPDGKIDKPDCSGQFLFTVEGHAAVQVMYRNAAQSGSTQYAQADTRRRLAGKPSTSRRTRSRFTSMVRSCARWSGRTCPARTRSREIS
jgi:hypothetical protein